MRIFVLSLVLMTWSLPAHLTPKFIIIGGADNPVGVIMRPLNYEGNGISPAVVIEDILVAQLSQSGLFHQPWQLKSRDKWNLHHWRLAGVRYLISGRIEENEQSIHLHLTITDTLGTTPTNVWVELNGDAWQQATRVFARQLLYSLFYATYTDDINSQYLNDTEPEETRYWIALVQTIKSHWHNRQVRGECRVNVTQLPGGQVQSYVFAEQCDEDFVVELQTLFEQLTELPYGGFNAPFAQNFTVNFVARG